MEGQLDSIDRIARAYEQPEQPSPFGAEFSATRFDREDALPGE